MIKAIKIDPSERRIYELDLKDSGLEVMYGALNCSTLEAPYVFPNQDTLWCDEEGLLLEDEEMIRRGAIFWFPTEQYIFGNILFTGSDDEGSTTSIKGSIEDIKKNFTFVDRDEIIKTAKRLGF